MSTQSKIFLESEGNGWFERNKHLLASKSSFYETDTIKRVLKPFKKEINNILEVGCSNGAKLKDLCSYFNASGTGADPSAETVRNGNDKFASEEGTKINLKVSTAANLPFPDSSFDLVYFGFCLYLVDRAEVFRAVAEADRVLKDNGFLAILDFDPGRKHKRPYHHKPGIFSYKTSYSDFFTAGSHYYLVAKESFSHAENHFSKDSNERVSVSVLYKETDTY